MATTKKPSPKKSTRKAPAKRASAATSRKAAPKKPSTRVRVRKKPQAQSLRLSREQRRFMTFTPTLETVYWIVLGLVCVAFSLWIAKLQADITSIYDSIDASSVQNQDVPVTSKKAR